MSAKPIPTSPPDTQRSIASADALIARDALALAPESEGYVLRLYVAGLTPRSVSAIRSVTEVCETHLEGRYKLEIVDIYEHPTLAKGEQIVAAPTLIKQLPLPLRRLIGDMADVQRVLVGLDLRPKDAGTGPLD